MKPIYWILLIAAAAFLYIESQDAGDDGGSGGGGAIADTIANIMAKFENANPAYNNPDAIQGTGDTGTTAGNGLGIFSSAEAGLAAGASLVESYISRFPGMTIREFVARYTTGNAGNESDSIDNEAGMLGSGFGVDPDSTTLGELGDP